MHRGGTSALTGVLRLSGLDVGPERELMAATDDNPRGFWELDRLSLFNERLLRELGGRWSGPPDDDPARLMSLAAGEMGERAGALFAELLPRDGWVWKDPRVCLLLPFWRSVLSGRRGPGDDRLVVVATVRNPREVAGSLEARDGLPVSYGLALWERHQRLAMAHSEGLPVYVVPYDSLLDDPVTACEPLLAFLADHGYRTDLDAARIGAEEFLDAGQRHHHATGGLRQVPEATAEQRALAEIAMQRTGDQTGRWHLDLPAESPGLQLAFDGLARMARFEDLAQQLEAGLAEQQADNRKLQQWLEDSRADAARAWSEVRRLEGQVHQLSETLADTAEGRDAVVAALEHTIRERDGWKWTVLQHEQRPAARWSRAARRALVGDDDLN